MPTLADSFAHILNYSEHVATVHHEHGKSHVHYEYMEEAKKNANRDNPYSNSSRKIDSSGEHLLFTSSQELLIFNPLNVYLKSFVQSLPATSPQEDLRPPIMLPA